MLPMTVLRLFDCVLASSKAKVLAEHARLKGGKVKGEALDQRLNKAASQRVGIGPAPLIQYWPI